MSREPSVLLLHTVSDSRRLVDRTGHGRAVESPMTPYVRRTGYSYKGITSPPHSDPMLLLLLLPLPLLLHGYVRRCS